MSSLGDLVDLPEFALGRVVMDVVKERMRQDELKNAGRFKFTCADDGLLDTERLAILVEEVGEASRAVLNAQRLVDDKMVFAELELKKELVQVAAIAVAWLEYLEKHKGGENARYEKV